jgi:hypothetical protein
MFIGNKWSYLKIILKRRKKNSTNAQNPQSVEERNLPEIHLRIQTLIHKNPKYLRYKDKHITTGHCHRQNERSEKMETINMFVHAAR